ncbi:hypothetical protein S83_035272, partial [Arachis hypogaea]
IVLKTLEDLQKIYLAIIPKKEVAKIKDKSTDQVFSMLDTSRLYHAAATCKLFRNWAKYPFCYSHIDLRTPVPKVNDALVATIIHRAGKALRSVDMWSTMMLYCWYSFLLLKHQKFLHHEPSEWQRTTRTVGVISKIDQAAAEPKALAA